MTIQTLTIVGVGLIGGSIGLAAKWRGLARRVLGVGRNPDALRQAARRGAIDEGGSDLAAAAARAEVTVFCTPVDCIPGQVLAAAPACAPGSLLTDAGSTKAVIVRAVAGRLPRGVAFVGSHPLAGSEKRGCEHARADLFQGRVTVVTPAPDSEPHDVERTVRFWQALGSTVKVMDPDGHDAALALTSHLPHLVASALAGVLPDGLGELTAGGFRDTTRVAAGDPSLWTAIFAQNRAAVLDALGRFTARLAEYRRALEENDLPALDRLWTQAKKVRDALGS